MKSSILIFILFISIISFGQIPNDSIQKIKIYDVYSVGGHLRKKTNKQLKGLDFQSIKYVELDSSDTNYFSMILKRSERNGFVNIALGRYTFGQIYYCSGLVETIVFTGYGQIYDMKKNQRHVITNKSDYDWIVKLYNGISDKLR